MLNTKASFLIFLKQRLKSTAFAAVIFTYLAFCITTLTVQIFNFSEKGIGMCCAYMTFVPLILIAEYLLNIRCGALFTAALLFIPAGSIMGNLFNVYTTVPFFDTVLHGTSGVIFAGLGFTVAEKFFGNGRKDLKGFFGCLVFAISFSLAIAVLWEIFEYTATAIFGLDLMADSYISGIASYLLSGTHSEAVELNGITQTIIYYGEGSTYVINGYLDIGLIDTLTDMIICTVGAVFFCILSFVGYIKFPKINDTLIPKCCVTKEGCECGENSANADI